MTRHYRPGEHGQDGDANHIDQDDQPAAVDPIDQGAGRDGKQQGRQAPSDSHARDEHRSGREGEREQWEGHEHQPIADGGDRVPGEQPPEARS